MSVPAPLLKIETPTGLTIPGRGFYQVEEDSLCVQIGEFSPDRKYFNYLESDSVRFDIDREGRLMLVEVTLPRRQWAVRKDLTVPGIGEPADIRWLDFRTRMTEPNLYTNPDRTILLIEFSPGASWRWVRAAKTVYVQTDENHFLTAMLIMEITDDLAGQALEHFRTHLRPRRFS